MRTLVEMGYETNAPIEVVNWTNEEGSRFAPAMLCSGVYAGVFTPEFAYGREDRDGKRFGDELERIGYRGSEPVGSAQAWRPVRAAHRAGADPRGRGQGDRRGPGRAGHALVRGHRHRPGRAYRRHAHASAQERAAGGRAHDRAHPPDRPGACAGGGGHGGPGRGPAQLAQRGARRGLLHGRLPPPRRGACWMPWSASSALPCPRSWRRSSWTSTRSGSGNRRRSSSTPS